MIRRDKWRLWLVGAIVIAGLVTVFPMGDRVRLGLDLRGGVHIVLQAKGIDGAAVEDDSVERLLAVIRNRIDQYGVTEPVIQRSGKDRVLVDLPGVEDPQAAVDLIGQTAQLEFRPVRSVSAKVPAAPQRKNYDDDASFEAAQGRWQAAKDEVTASETKMKEEAKSEVGSLVAQDEAGTAYRLGPTAVSGNELQDAKTNYDNLGRAVVSLQFNSQGKELFDKATAENVGKQLAIVLDGQVISAPVVQERISGGQAQISGRFTPQDAQRLAIMLRAGALPVPVEILENRSVGPSLGADSIQAGLKAGYIATALVVFFMMVYYRFMGIAANVALAVAMLLLFAGLITLKATLTLPGIAGIILTIGMAVDGNILIYERIREEARAGKTPMAALDAGFRRAFATILDSNLTTLIAAAALYYFGSGPIRGFAVTLAIGIVVSVFSAVVVTRVLLQAMAGGSRGSWLIRS